MRLEEKRKKSRVGERFNGIVQSYMGINSIVN